MAIQFACPYCNEVSSVPASFAGKKGKCPNCKKVIEVPNPDARVENSVPEPEPEAPSGRGDGGSRGPTKSCRYCGETIKRVAKKCRYCGEFLEKGLKGKRGVRNHRRPPPNHLMLAILSAVFCCTPIGVVAIIYAAQVETKFYADDLRGAQAASDKAQTWGYTAVGLGILVVGVYLAVVIGGA